MARSECTNCGSSKVKKTVVEEENVMTVVNSGELPWIRLKSSEKVPNSGFWTGAHYEELKKELQ